MGRLGEAGIGVEGVLLVGDDPRLWTWSWDASIELKLNDD